MVFAASTDAFREATLLINSFPCCCVEGTIAGGGSGVDNFGATTAGSSLLESTFKIGFIVNCLSDFDGIVMDLMTFNGSLTTGLGTSTDGDGGDFSGVFRGIG